MAFVRKKRVNGHEYYQVVENYRENGKVRQRMLEHLGKYPTVEEAIEYRRRKVEHYRYESRRAKATANMMYREYREGVYHEWFRRGLNVTALFTFRDTYRE